MIFDTDHDVYKLVKAFEDRTITKSEWTHAAHLAVGMFYCRKFPFSVAKNLMRDGIYWLNDRHGTPNTDVSGYHETLTVFWMKTIWNFLDEKSAYEGLAALANELIERFNDPNLPLRFYAREHLFSTEARLNFLRPEEVPTPKRRFATTMLTVFPL